MTVTATFSGQKICEGPQRVLSSSAQNKHVMVDKSRLPPTLIYLTNLANNCSSVPMAYPCTQCNMLGPQTSEY